MALSVFEDKSKEPDGPALQKVVGRAWSFWTALVDAALTAGATKQVWNHAGPKFGWSLRILKHERVLIVLTPESGSFLVGVALGEKAIAKARTVGLPKAVEAIIDAAPKYAEGRGVRYRVKTARDLAAAKVLLRVKMIAI